MEKELKIHGRGKIRLRPDTVCADVTIEGLGKTCAEALTKADEAFGRVKMNSVPIPSVLITSMFSLWAVRISFVMESPSPVPPISREWDLSTR